jgi:hypothetical protein
LREELAVVESELEAAEEVSEWAEAGLVLVAESELEAAAMVQVLAVPR